MKTIVTQRYPGVILLVSCILLSISGCQSADSGGTFTGFTNPMSSVPSQSEPPISTLEPAEEEPTVATEDEKAVE